MDAITHVKEFCNTITHAKIFGDFGAPKRVKCVRTKPERTPKNKTVNIIEQNEKEVFMDGCNENVIEFMTNDIRATLSFSQGRYKSVIRKLAEKHPEDCQIIADNEDGSIYSAAENGVERGC